MKRLIALLLLIPLFDIVILVGIATWIGAVATVAIVVLTALIGMLLVRAEGRHTVRRVERALASGELPDNELIDGALLIASGAFFLTPGVVTDFVGLVLVLPPTRYPVRLLVKRYVIRPYIDRKTGGFASGSVYVAGFPNQDGDTINLGDDDFSVDSGGDGESEH